MRILAAFMAVGAIGFGLFTAIFGIVSPAQEPHAFHNVIVAALLIVLSAPPVIAIAREPREAARPLVILAVIGIAALGTMALSLTLDPFTLPFVVLVAVLWALAPERRLALPEGRPSLPLIGLSAVALAVLAPYVLDQAALQRTDDTSEHAAFFHWVEVSFYAAAAPLVGIVSGLRPSAFRIGAWSAGLALVVLGAGSLLLDGYASALPAIQAWLAVGIGAAILAVTAWHTARRET